MYFGSSYYPPHHNEEDWERDIKRMAEAGLTVIRSAELLASWDRIEKEPGAPDFAWVDRLFELCEKHGLQILLGTGACNPPIWMVSEYPDIQILSRDDIPYPTGGMWSWACINHPAYIKETDRYLGQLLDRYKDHSVLMGWQIHNEPGYPFVARRGEEPDWFCYNPYTIAAFREWLEQKYEGSIDALNDAWRWDPTHHQYRSFSEVPAPRVPPMEWGVIGAWLDWRQFTNDNWAQLIRRQHEIIKLRDSDHPTMTNLMGEATDFNGRLGVDPWKLAAEVDVIGFDLYPGLKERGAPDRGRRASGPHFASWFLDFSASVARANNSTFWLPEMESGPLDGWVKGPRYTTEGCDIRRWAIQSLAHGTSMILYQGYREWNCIPIHWGALVDLHGEPTERYHAAAEIGQLFSQHSDLLDRITPSDAEVALLYDHANVLATAAMGAEDFTKNGLQGLYEALWRAGFRTDFVSPASQDFSSYRVIMLPYAMRMTLDMSAKLMEFVRRGGVLIGFAKCAMLDERGWLWNDSPGAGLDELFGVNEKWIDVQQTPVIIVDMPGGRTSVNGYHHRQDLVLGSGVEVLGRFEDGAPAIIRNEVGKGSALYFGTHFDIASAGSSEHSKLITALLMREGVKPSIAVTGEESELVDAHLLVSSDGPLLAVANESYQEVNVWIDFDINRTKVNAPNNRTGSPNFIKARDLLSSTTVAAGLVGDRCAIKVSLQARDATLFQFE